MPCIFDIRKEDRHCRYCSAICDERQPKPVEKAIDESLAKNAKANDALQEGLRNGKKAVLIIGDDMPDYKCIFIPNGFSAKIEGNKVIFTKDKEPASNEVSEMKFKRLDIPELEKAAMNYSKFYTCIQAFKAGAKWQKEQMMKDSIDGICISNGAECGSTIESSAGMLFLQHSTFNAGDKVKIKIIKED